MLEALVLSAWLSAAAYLQVTEGIGAIERIALGSSPIVAVLLIACVALIAVMVINSREQRYLTDRFGGYVQRLEAAIDKLTAAEGITAKELRLLRTEMRVGAKGGPL